MEGNITQELFKFYTPRNPDPLKEDAYPAITIASHPTNYRSERFIQWLECCGIQDYVRLRAKLTDFLKSDESITSISDYQTDVARFLESALSKGKSITKEDIVNSPDFIKISNKKILLDAILRTADSLLAMVVLGNTSSAKNISHQDILKLLLYIDHIANQKVGAQQINLKDYLRKQIMLPPCFFYLNPCSKKIVNKADFFSLNAKSQPTRGCIERTPCDCVPDDNCTVQNPCCATIKPYITDLMVVREEDKCYMPGELSYIENVVIGENRTRLHTHLERTEEYQEQETDISTDVEKDQEETEKFSLQKETDNTVKQDLSLDAGVTYNTKWGVLVASSSISANFNSSLDWSSSTTQKIAQDYSKDVVNRSITKVEQKIRQLVTRKQINQTEEKNRHVFNNASGTDNISAQYFYVNKISRAQVFNYGKRLLCDILVPEPSELYKRLLAKQFTFNLEEPIKPTETITTIGPDNWLQLVQKYGLTDCDPPPTMTQSITQHITGDNGKGKTGCVLKTDIQITVPIGYVTASISAYEVNVSWNDDGGISWTIILGGDSVWHSKGDGTEVLSVNIPPLEGTQAIGFRTWDVTSYDILFTVNLTVKSDVLNQWKMGIYNKIMEIYQKQKQEYDDAYNKALEEFNNDQSGKYTQDPFLNRETERIALKQMAISYISCKFYDEMNAMKNKVRPCGFPQMDLEETEREGRWVQFFEQAFEWPLMTYLFYPYFWGRKCTWVDKMKQQANDPIFEKFLQSGFARLQIPIRPGFEELVQYFLAFGEIWQGNDTPPLPGDSYYVSLAQEIREDRGNFYADRDGTLQFSSSSDPLAPNNTVILTDDTKHYWDVLSDAINQLNIDADIDREIIIDCEVYRIISIAETNPPDPDHKTWTITIDRKYDGASFSNMKWSTGAVYVGAPWEFITPTELVWLRGKAKCLPSYPIQCEE